MTYSISRRSQKIIVIIILVTIGLLSALDRHFQKPSPAPVANNYASDIKKYHNKQFIVSKVVDGDTLDIDIANGKYQTTRIRLWGVDCPETKHPYTKPMYYGQQAADFTKIKSLNKTVTVMLDKDNNSRGKYGRLLAYIKLEDGQYLNELLLSNGYCYADVRFKHSHYKKYKQLEKISRYKSIGLWNDVRFSQLPTWLQRARPGILKKRHHND